MRYRETRPAPDLAPYVHCIWELEGGREALAEPIFPDGRVEIVVHLGDRPSNQLGPERSIAPRSTAQPDVMVVGQMTTALWLRPVTRLHAVGIRFTPTGARAWLDAPLHELTDRVHEVDAVRGQIAARVRDAVHGGLTASHRLNRIQHLLRATLRPRLRASRPLEHAVHLTLARSGRVTVDALAQACGLSARHLERQYLERVGLTPKAFARTVRFQRALRDLQDGVPAAFAAAGSGFADQAHLAREFRRFAGVAARQVDLAHVAFLQDAPVHPVGD